MSVCTSTTADLGPIERSVELLTLDSSSQQTDSCAAERLQGNSSELPQKSSDETTPTSVSVADSATLSLDVEKQTPVNSNHDDSQPSNHGDEVADVLSEESGDEESEDEDEDDDEEGWITPDNIGKIKEDALLKDGQLSLVSTVVACITTDFAMQVMQSSVASIT